MAIFYFLAINISCVYANDIGVDNYQYECRIGPIGVHDTFDMNQLNMFKYVIWAYNSTCTAT